MNVLKILKNLFLNLAENIHILMKNGKIQNINTIKVILKLFIFIFTKKEIIDIFSLILPIIISLFKNGSDAENKKFLIYLKHS